MELELELFATVLIYFLEPELEFLHKSRELPKTPSDLWHPLSSGHHLGCMDDVWIGKNTFFIVLNKENYYILL